MKFLSEAYVFGNSAYEDEEEAKKEIKEINKKLFEKSEPELQIYYDKGRKWSLEKLDEIYLKLGTKFDKLYFESEMAEPGKKIVLDNLSNGIFEKSEGAVHQGFFDVLPVRASCKRLERRPCPALPPA